MGSVPGVSKSNSGGTFQSIHTEYNSATNRVLFNAIFADRVTDGFTLRLGDGSTHANHSGETAMIYFDATSLATPKVTAYGYNGQSWETTYTDGNGSAWGSPNPDVIHSANNTSWITSASALNISGNRRSFNLEIDASIINGHAPTAPGPEGAAAWDGIRFGNSINLWMSTFDSLSTSYTGSGRINCWSDCGNGYFTACDEGNLVVVPLPASAYMGIAGLGMVALVARRRTNRANRA